MKGEQFTPGNDYAIEFVYILEFPYSFVFEEAVKIVFSMKLKLTFYVYLFFRCLEYEKLNPIGYVPTLVDGDSVIADSFAILMVCPLPFGIIACGFSCLLSINRLLLF